MARTDDNQDNIIPYDIVGLINESEPVGDRVTDTRGIDVTDSDVANADGIIVQWDNADGLEVTKTIWGPILDLDQLDDIVDTEVFSVYE